MKICLQTLGNIFYSSREVANQRVLQSSLVKTYNTHLTRTSSISSSKLFFLLCHWPYVPGPCATGVPEVGEGSSGVDSGMLSWLEKSEIPVQPTHTPCANISVNVLIRVNTSFDFFLNSADSMNRFVENAWLKGFKFLLSPCKMHIHTYCMSRK